MAGLFALALLLAAAPRGALFLAADPLAGAPICHAGEAPGAPDPAPDHQNHAQCCLLACAASAWLAAPDAARLPAPRSRAIQLAQAAPWAAPVPRPPRPFAARAPPPSA